MLKKIAWVLSLSFLSSIFLIVGVSHAQSASPFAPTSVSASLSSPGEITVTWAAPTASTTNPIAGYYVYRNGNMVANTAGLSFVDNVSAGGYSYTVAAYDTAGNTLPQSLATTEIFIVSDNTPPTAPTGLTVSSLASTSVTLSWSAASDNIGVVGYYLIRNGSRVLTSSAINGTSYTDSNLAPDINLVYQVEAYDAAGNISPGSNALSVSTLPASFTISTPYNLSANAVSESEIDLSWGASVDVSGTPIYYIYRDSIPYATTTATSFQDSGLPPGTSYGYSIAAFDASGALSGVTPMVGTSTFRSSSTAPVVSPATVFPMQVVPPTAGVNTPTSVQFTAMLYAGIRSAQVTALQNVLIEQGDLGSIYVTGYFGALTQKAVQKFQCAQNIVCSGSPWTTGWGLVGVRTRKALNSLGV